MKKNIDPILFEKVFKSIPLGLFILDEGKNILAWNSWMEEKTGLTEKNLIGENFYKLYSKFSFERFNFALDQVLTYGNPQVLSQTLNHYLIPIPLKKFKRRGTDMMQQHVEILPVQVADARVALITVHDVTYNVKLKNTLIEMGQKFEDKTYHDALTGIYNRRFLWEWIDLQMKKSFKKNAKIVCTMYDLDFFKRINDEFGHETGDKVLIEFVKLVSSSLRSSDLFVRYGGEEFLVFQINVDEKHTSDQYYRIQKLLAAPSTLNKKTGVITCSAGTSIWLPSNPVDAKTLIDQADTALYEAKRKGRNQVCFFTPVT